MLLLQNKIIILLFLSFLQYTYMDIYWHCHWALTSYTFSSLSLRKHTDIYLIFISHLFFTFAYKKQTLHDMNQHLVITSFHAHSVYCMNAKVNQFPCSWNNVKVQKAFVSAPGEVLLIFFQHHNPQRHWSICCYILDQDPFFSSRAKVRSPLLWPFGRLRQ